MKTEQISPELLDMRIGDIAEMSESDLRQVLKIAMARFNKLTGRSTISHMPESEMTQAKKEFGRDLKPITVSDFVELKVRTGKTTVDFCEMLGITRQRYYEINGKSDKREVLKEIPLCLLIRLYQKLPSLVPKAPPTPLEVHEVVGGGDKINFQAMAIVFGRGGATARRWKKGIYPSEISRPVLEAIAASTRPDEIMDVMIDNVYEEGKVRGMTPFLELGWNGTPQEGPVKDIDRSFLSMPTVDHRRVEAREGKVVGWGATDLGVRATKRKAK